MPNVEWEVPHTITSPLGSLALNATDPLTLRRFQILDAGYVMGPTLRVTQDDKSQADGSVLHPRYKSGLAAALTVQFQVQTGTSSADYLPACEQDLREMNDQLLAHLNAMRRLTTSTQRLLWTPSGYIAHQRMLDAVQLLSWPTPGRDGIVATQAFSFESPFPYAIDSDEVDQTLLDGAGATLIANDGSADFFPVMQVQGPTTAFTITDTISGLEVVYDGTRAGASAIAGGHYGEIDFFRGTIFLDGNSSDLIAGIDPANTDFFPIPQTGGTTVEIVGADVLVKSNAAWS